MESSLSGNCFRRVKTSGKVSERASCTQLLKKKNEMMPLAATWMDLEIIILSEVSQKEKDKYYMISLKCGI